MCWVVVLPMPLGGGVRRKELLRLVALQMGNLGCMICIMFILEENAWKYKLVQYRTTGS